jgi:glutathione S-transferase
MNPLLSTSNPSLTYLRCSPGRSEHYRPHRIRRSKSFRSSRRKSSQSTDSYILSLVVLFIQANLGRAPILYVDGVGIGQSKTILRFLARQLGFAGDNEMAIAKGDMLMECISDFKDGFGKAAPPMMGPETRSEEEAAKAMSDYWIGEKGLDKLLPRMEALLEGPFCLGEKPSVADVVIFSFFKDNTRFQACEQYEATMAASPKLTALCEAFGQLENVAKWITDRPQTMF